MPPSTPAPAPLAIGPYTLSNRLFAAPMAGVGDRAFRRLCRRLGAGYAVGEMVSSQRALWATPKSLRRTDHAGDGTPVAVQIAGAEPSEMADAARHQIDRGAQIVDINMGCPAKKVCHRWAGSALMQDVPLALAIVNAVVAACAPRGVPVTLKMRSGASDRERNALVIARAAEAAGVAMVVVHGRTREQGFRGDAEYATVGAVKAALSIPVVANGDIDSPHKAARVLRTTGVDAVMIGRAAQGRPWLFGEIAHFLAHGRTAPAPLVADVRRWLLDHLREHHALYGADLGVRTARKHIGWALRGLPGGDAARTRLNAIDDADAQAAALDAYFAALQATNLRLPSADSLPLAA